MFKKYTVIIISYLLLISCIPQKKIVYIQDSENKATSKIEHQVLPYLLQPGDVLSIRVHSIDPSISTFFNIENVNGIVQNNPANLYVNGYSITDSGFVKIPMIGLVNIVNQTVEKAQETIQGKINVHLKNATVLVRLVSNKISILGDISKPGYYNIYNDRISILEAISMAGDITATGNREKVKIVRQKADHSEIYIVDLTKPQFISSESYFLQPNDVVYIEPLRAKATRNNLAPLTVVFAGVSAFILLLNFLFNVSKSK